MARETKKVAEETVRLLGAVPLFSGCTDAELRQISQLGTILSVKAGTNLTTQGAAGHEFILLRSGHADCVRDDAVVATFGPGDFFGELALLDGGARTATVTATDGVEVLVLSHGEFNDLLDRAPSIARKLLVELASRERRAFMDSVTQ